MTKKSKMFTMLSALMLSGVLAACDEPKGPAEKAGEKIDEGTKKVGEAMEDAGEKMKDAVD